MTLLLMMILAAPAVELMPIGEAEQIRRAMPHVTDQEVNVVLRHESTMWYDDRSMPQAYQDPIPPITGLRTPHSPVAPAEIFSGGKFRFPWGHTAGTHRCDNCRTVKFLSLPQENGKTLPVVYWRDGLEFRWSFPVGTMVGEVLMLNSPSGQPFVFEIRIRKREHDNWQIDAFRPFPTSRHLMGQLMQTRPEWRKDQNLVGLVSFLNDSTTITPSQLRDDFGVFAENAGVDVLPAMEDELVQELLLSTAFQSCQGETWKRNAGVECHAPTTEDPFSIVPANYDGGLVPVHEQSCARCHETTSQPISNFDGARVLYGKIWGSDQVFSFHPLDPGQVTGDADYGGGELRQDFLTAGIVAAYDANVHTNERYSILPSQQQ